MLLKNFNNHAADALPEHIKPSEVDIWFQDESRVGQQGTITRQWAEKGTRPRLSAKVSLSQRIFMGLFVQRRERLLA